MNIKIKTSLTLILLIIFLLLTSCEEFLNHNLELSSEGVSSDSLVYWKYEPSTHSLIIGANSNTKSVSSEDLPSVLGTLGMNLSFNNDVYSIKENGFSNYFVNSLTSLSIPESVSYVGASAFSGISIKNLVIPEDTSTWDTNWQDGCESDSINGTPTASYTGEFTESIQAYIYEFDVTSGENYIISWNDFPDGTGLYTADVKVSAKDELGNLYFTDRDSGYSTPQSITAIGSRLIVTVTPYSYGNTGTFELKLQSNSDYSLLSSSNYIYSLSEIGEFTDSIQSYEYRFSVISGENYIINWDDSLDGTGQHSANAKVTAKDEAGNVYFTNMDSGYLTPQSITAMDNTLIISVIPYNSGDTGTFELKLQSNSYCCLSSSSNYTYSLSEIGEFTDSIQSYEYRFYVTSGDNYLINWYDSLDGTGQYSANVKVTAQDELGNVYFTDMDSGYSTSQSFTTIGSRLIITVTPFSSGTTGTFELKLQSNSYCYLSSSSNYIYSLSAIGEFTDSIQSCEYEFSVGSEGNFSIMWDDCYDGSSVYTADVKVSAKDELGNAYFTDIDSGYSTPQSFNSIGSSLIITVTPFSSGGTGTFKLTIQSDYEIYQQ